MSAVQNPLHIRYNEQRNELEFGPTTKLTLSKAIGYQVLDSNRVRVLSGGVVPDVEVLADFMCGTAENADHCVQELMRARVQVTDQKPTGDMVYRFEVHPDHVDHAYYSTRPIYLKIEPDQIDNIQPLIQAVRNHQKVSRVEDINDAIEAKAGKEIAAVLKAARAKEKDEFKEPGVQQVMDQIDAAIIAACEQAGDLAPSFEQMEAMAHQLMEQMRPAHCAPLSEKDMAANRAEAQRIEEACAPIFSVDESGKATGKSGVVVTEWPKVRKILMEEGVIRPRASRSSSI